MQNVDIEKYSRTRQFISNFYKRLFCIIMQQRKNYMNSSRKLHQTAMVSHAFCCNYYLLDWGRCDVSFTHKHFG